MRSIGNQTYYAQPVRLYTDVLNGNVVESSWVGRADYLLADFLILATGGQQAEYTSDGTRGEVRVRYGNVPLDGNPEVPTVAFSMRTEEINQSIFKHPRFSALTFSVVKAIQDEIGGGGHEISSDNDTAAGYAGSFARIRNAAALASNDPDLALEAYRLMLAGDEHYLVTQSYTLTMTRTSSRGFDLPLIFADDGKLFSSNGLANYTATVLPFLIPQLNTLTSSQALQLVFAWRKRGTDVQDLTNGNVQVSEQWQSARWSLLLYSIASWG